MLAGSSELDLDEGGIPGNVLKSQPDPASLVCPVVHDVDRDRVSWLALNKPEDGAEGQHMQCATVT